MTPAVSPAVPPAAAPAPAVELTPADKKRVREEARREFKARELARIAAKSAPAAAPAGAPAPAAASTPADPTRTDAQRAADAAVFLRGVLWPFLGVGAYLAGYTLREFTVAMSVEDAASWVPLARRYRWVDLLITWAGAPARVLARVRELAQKRGAGKKAEAAP